MASADRSAATPSIHPKRRSYATAAMIEASRANETMRRLLFSTFEKAWPRQWVRVPCYALDPFDRWKASATHTRSRRRRRSSISSSSPSTRSRRPPRSGTHIPVGNPPASEGLGARAPEGEGARGSRYWPRAPELGREARIRSRSSADSRRRCPARASCRAQPESPVRGTGCFEGRVPPDRSGQRGPRTRSGPPAP
jgi:hypothetical protein